MASTGRSGPSGLGGRGAGEGALEDGMEEGADEGGWAGLGAALAEADEDEEIWLEDAELIGGAWRNLEEIRRAGKLCDVGLVVRGPSSAPLTLHAHKVVLAASVPYFRAMFTHEMAEASQATVEMRGVEAEVLEQLISYAYSGRVRIAATNVQALMEGAAFLQLQPILQACSNFLEQRLQGSNVLALRSFAAALGAESLLAAADRFLHKHFVAVSRTLDFGQLGLDDLLSVLQEDSLHVDSEEQVFQAAMGWIQAELETRKVHLPAILEKVRLPLLRPAFIADVVAGNALVRDDLGCRDLVDEAKDYHLMPERRPLLQRFRTKPRCCYDVPGIIYAVGGLTNAGDSLSTVEMYDPMLGKWSSIQPMSTLRSRVGVAVMQGLLYAIGGFNGQERLRTVEVFDPERRSWKEVGPLNNKRSALGAAVCNERLFVCGGYDGVSSLASVEVLERATGKWALAQPMSKQRSASGIAVLDGHIYILGGHDGMSIFSSVERFDPSTSTWKPVKGMGSRRCRLGACALNGKLYVCGGYDGQQFLKSAEVYDPLTEEWTPLGPMNVKRSRVALVANCGRLFAIGGYDGMSNLASMETYDAESNSWAFAASMQAHEGGVGIGVVPITPKTDIP